LSGISLINNILPNQRCHW